MSAEYRRAIAACNLAALILASTRDELEMELRWWQQHTVNRPGAR